MSNAQALGREAMTAVGGISGLFSILWNLFWFAAVLGFLLIVAVVAIVVGWKFLAWAKTFSFASLLGQVISETRGAFGASTVTIPATPIASEIADPIALKNQILDAVAPMAAKGDPAIAAAKAAKNETEALKLTVNFLSGRNAVGGAN